MSGSAAAVHDRDPGLQPERTALAWRRTALSASAVAILMVHELTDSGSPVGALAGGFGLVTMVVILGLAHRRGRRLRHGFTQLRPAGAAVLVVLSVVTIATAAASVVMS